MKARFFAAAALVGLSFGTFSARAADPASCDVVRIGDVGWSDAAATIGVTSNILTALGYTPKTTLVTLSVAYLSMENNRIDVFPSDWEPSGESVIGPYMKRGRIERIATNLDGAHYTLGVPDYVSQEGLKDFKDIAAWGPKLNYTIYGIESGNDGNQIILKLIKENQFGLGKFHLNESSEQGMLSQVTRAIGAHKPIVFLAWEPHPMNMRFKITYLTGGEKDFGAAASVHTVTRKGYVEACPNVGKLFKQMTFTIPGENEMMKAIGDDRIPAPKATKDWLKANSGVLDKWLDGVTTADGAPGLPAVKKYLGVE